MRNFTLLNHKNAVILFLLWGSAIPSNAEVFYSNELKVADFPIGNMLEWSTASEMDSKIFYIEKSEDGINFTVVGDQPAAGKSIKEIPYRFLDTQAGNKKTFYRLRQLDKDGTSSFSQTVILKNQFLNNFLVLNMSNTSTVDYFDITFDATTEKTMTYSLINRKTKDVIKESTLDVINGINSITIDLREEQIGIYEVLLKIEEEEEILIIQRIKDELQKKPNVASKKSSNGG